MIPKSLNDWARFLADFEAGNVSDIHLDDVLIGYPQKDSLLEVVQIFCLDLIVDSHKTIDHKTRSALLSELRQGIKITGVVGKLLFLDTRKSTHTLILK